MRLSIVLIILLFAFFGLLMIVSAVGMHERDSWVTRIILFIVGVGCLILGGYLFYIYVLAS
ncbi:hypothetical protein SAMN05216431_10563 [Ligilactobacillus sp. WC1T17]|uniref:Uncharacterized protein n=1 Tax=Ligilactobacillus ruminis TaxID=1623 RepID=A0ABY1AB78_9LACO|nr:hypothetical protein SAMN05216431_10563 [Ligilactobacillus ruminis]